MRTLIRPGYIAAVLVFAACSSGGKSSGGEVTAHMTCAAARPLVEAAYRAEIAATTDEADRKRLEKTIADNVEMVMNDCTADEPTRGPCLYIARDVAAIERSCLAPLDDEGTMAPETATAPSTMTH